MLRRAFLALIGLGAAAGLQPAEAALPEKPKPLPGLRRVERWTDGRWRTVRLSQCSPGDRIRFDDLPGEWRVDGVPWLNSYNVWEADGSLWSDG